MSPEDPRFKEKIAIQLSTQRFLSVYLETFQVVVKILSLLIVLTALQAIAITFHDNLLALTRFGEGFCWAITF